MTATILRKGGLLLLSTIVCYGLAELVYSTLYRYGVIDPPSGVFLENPGGTIAFDPVSGYRAPRVPARGIRIDGGEVEYETVVRGNKQGFYDADDFAPARADRATYRIAVLGDSFSSAPYLATNWTDRVEALSRRGDGPRLELLNFSLDAVGLANWRNIVVRKLAPENYDVDLVLFAVFDDDLHRSFRVMDLRGQKHLAVGDAGWDPTAWPRTDADVRGRLAVVESYHVVSPADYERVVRDGWHPDLPRPGSWRLSREVAARWRDWRARLHAWVRGDEASSEERATSPAGGTRRDAAAARLSPAQWRLVEDIRRVLAERRIPVAVVRIPSREDLASRAPMPADVLEFAQALGATLIEGADAFKGLTPEQQRAQYFVHDGHWNQEGSDRFAQAMLPVLEGFAAPFLATTRSTAAR